MKRRSKSGYEKVKAIIQQMVSNGELEEISPGRYRPTWKFYQELGK